ncbi:MAG: CoB--CoM heterodisulfide reductase iron-sulfur subunit A family protein [Deltaproteobacteria bacterium]|nr:CoB--CoM heterodisulfide reductase iron-sulfur subunit A family protein [Deltaproteobacteria bacterium]
MSEITVLLCRCFGEIDQTISFATVREKLDKDSNISSSICVDSLCIGRDIDAVISQIRESGVKKVLIGACSGLARGDQAVQNLMDRGIARADIHLVDLREGCAWIHRDNPDGASQKALNLIDMGLVFLKNKDESDDVSVTMNPDVMVIGAGPAGLAAALSLGRFGITVHLLERSSTPGGMLKLITRSYPKDDATTPRLEQYLDQIEKSSFVRFYPRSKISSIKGYMGNFKVRFSSGEEEQSITPGAIIIASGAMVFLPNGLFRYGELGNVISQMELETRFKKGNVTVKNAVFIQCVGARCKDRPYCSTICCPSSIKNAIRIREDNPDTNVFILHRDVMTPGNVLEGYYIKALSRGVQFIRFAEDNPPVIKGEKIIEAVEVYDAITGHTRTIESDLVVLSTPLIPNHDNQHLAEMLDLQLDRYGFFREIYPMHPLETRMDGVFICGSARWPVSSGQAITQGEAAAMKAASVVLKGEVRAFTFSRVPGLKFGHARVTPDSCTGCGNCMAVCPFDAIRLQRIDGKYAYVSRVNKMRCKACGNCVSVCPNGTMQMPEHNYLSVCKMIEKAF